VLELVDVSKSYRGTPAVRALTLAARPGDVVGLLGPNGSGKSTTVRMIVGMLAPSRGTVRWRGVDIQQQLLDYQALVGWVPEEPRLYPYLTAVEYLGLVGGLRDIPRTVLARRIDRYLELFDLRPGKGSSCRTSSPEMS
jgi:ABC-2 type transport system ATP-binding protein